MQLQIWEEASARVPNALDEEAQVAWPQSLLYLPTSDLM